MTARGSLTVVGTGIKLVGDVTLDAKASMERAEKLLYLVADPAVESWVRNLNRTAESLYPYYAPGKPRRLSYKGMVRRILECVREGLDVCAAFYGHPGICCDPAHEAIRRARKEGYTARMLPGVSAEDCLFADLAIDPAIDGYQSYDATDFVLCRRRIEPRSSLILWQLGLLGEMSNDASPKANALEALVEVLGRDYPMRHRVVIYAASIYPISGPTMIKTTLKRLPKTEFPPVSTLFVSPAKKSVVDTKMMKRLGLNS